MRLIIDIGNTNVKLGLFDNNNLVKKTTCDLNNKQKLKTILLDHSKLEYIFFCGSNNKLKRYIQNIIKPTNVILIEWKKIKKNIINIQYDNVDSLGFDRLGVSVGANFLYPEYKNHLIIDVGSCITYDIVLNKNYQGGQISPGINMRLKSLKFFTKSLPELEFSKPNTLLGNSTVDSIQSGVFFGILDELLSRINFYKKQISNLNVIITGGSAIHFKKNIKNVTFDDDLLMKGLNLLLENHVKK